MVGLGMSALTDAGHISLSGWCGGRRIWARDGNEISHSEQLDNFLGAIRGLDGPGCGTARGDDAVAKVIAEVPRGYDLGRVDVRGVGANADDETELEAPDGVVRFV